MLITMILPCIRFVTNFVWVKAPEGPEVDPSVRRLKGKGWLTYEPNAFELVVTLTPNSN